MLLLSLDAAFSYQNFTLFEAESGRCLLQWGEDRGKKSLELFPKIFKDLGVDPRSVDLFAVNLGPGYSTSLRVGITLIKTYAQVSKKPLVTYTSFEAMLPYLGGEGEYLLLVKVSRYWVFSRAGVARGKVRLSERPGVLSEEVLTELSRSGERPTFATPRRWKGELEEFLKGRFEVRGLPLEGFSYGGALAALEKVGRGEFADLFKVEPVYFRPPV
ncbi:MAG: hypothetical protein GXO08_00790 [Aquificae bacterium]|nr:hypothetical protein [Aquificota bacterium]